MIAEEFKVTYQKLFGENKFKIEELKEELKDKKNPKETIEKIIEELEKREFAFKVIIHYLHLTLEDIQENLIGKDGNFLSVGLLSNWKNGKKYFQFAKRLKDRILDLSNNINNVNPK